MGRSFCRNCGSFRVGTVFFLDQTSMDLCDECSNKLHYPYIQSISQVGQEWFDMIEDGVYDSKDVEHISTVAWTRRDEIEDSIL